MTERHEQPESTAERHGIVDQQGAALEAAAEQVPEPGTGSPGGAAAEHGIVDQQDAARTAMEDEDRS